MIQYGKYLQISKEVLKYSFSSKTVSKEFQKTAGEILSSFLSKIVFVSIPFLFKSSCERLKINL